MKCKWHPDREAVVEFQFGPVATGYGLCEECRDSSAQGMQDSGFKVVERDGVLAAELDYNQFRPPPDRYNREELRPMELRILLDFHESGLHVGNSIPIEAFKAKHGNTTDLGDAIANLLSKRAIGLDEILSEHVIVLLETGQAYLDDD